MCHFARFATLVLVLACPLRAAASRAVALSWVRAPGAESCITLPELASRVEGRVAGLSFVPAADAEINVEGSIGGDSSTGWTATLIISDAAGRVLGRRTLASTKPACRSIDEGLVLVIALALDPSQGFVALPDGFAGNTDPADTLLSELRASPPLTAAPADSGGAPPPRAASPARPEPAAPAEPGLALEAGLDLSAAVGLVPAVGFGAAVSGRLLLPDPDWGLELRLEGVLPRAARPAGGGVVDIAAISAAVGACSPAWGLFRGCAGTVVGALVVHARELSGSRDALRGIVDPYASIELAYRVGVASFRARASVEVPLARDRLQVLSPEGRAKPAFRPALLVGRLGLGVFLHWGS